jgi:hypothetical protein
MVSNNPEARSWLLANGNATAFATNRFQSTTNAIAFVDGLYAAGATEVLIDNILDDHAAREGGAYADTLIIHFADDPSSRKRLRTICEHAIEGEADGRVDEAAGEIRIWWD